ncbi:FecR domain-containing protein [Rapidithrix thailandica]|uniref:FecR domain-containing protein n=1 Tax=Rapidithrix thailandica TaxID=413964 RepID=A0AAW9RRU5_9BACT
MDMFEIEKLIQDPSFQNWVYHSNPQDFALWEKRIQEHPEKREVVEVAAQMLKGMPVQEHGLDQEEIHQEWEMLQEKLSQPSVSPKRENYHNRKDQWTLWIKVAAMITVVMGVGLITWWNQYQTPPRALHWVEKQNPAGQRSVITLSDGSKVWLNAASKLRFPEVFSEKKRTVFLEGEAFFEVSKDPSRVFKVHSGSSTVAVLGTSFNINAFAENDRIEVALASGKVLFESEGIAEKVPLSPEELLSFDTKNRQWAKSQFNKDEVLGWKDNILYFQDASFEEVVKKLERWYGVEFIVRRKVPVSKGFTGWFKQKPLEHVLKGIGFSSKFDYRIEDKKVLIY